MDINYLNNGNFEYNINTLFSILLNYLKNKIYILLRNNSNLVNNYNIINHNRNNEIQRELINNLLVDRRNFRTFPNDIKTKLIILYILQKIINIINNNNNNNNNNNINDINIITNYKFNMINEIIDMNLNINVLNNLFIQIENIGYVNAVEIFNRILNI